MADGLHDMGLAQTDSTVDKERIVGLARALADGQGGRMAETVVGAHYKCIEAVFGIEVTSGYHD